MDVYQYNISKKFPNEQDFFMRYIEPARASRATVMHIGTNAIFRRKYVEEVGLYPTNTITEDMALGLLLQSHGYKSLYINKTLVCGLGVSSYPDLVKQRDRWCRGNLQILRNYKKTLFKKLKFKQSMIYLDGIFYWLSGLMKMIFILTPIIFLLTGFTIVNLPPKFMFPLFVVAFSMQIILSKCILPKKISSHYFNFFMRGEFYNTIIAPHLAFSVLKHYILSPLSGLKFNVTRKNFSTKKAHYHLKLALPHIILLIMGIISIIVGTMKLGKGLYLDSYLINVFWVLYNIPGLAVALKLAYQPARNITNEGISIITNDKIKKIITDKHINDCINELDYRELDKLITDIIENITPYKSNLIP